MPLVSSSSPARELVLEHFEHPRTAELSVDQQQAYKARIKALLLETDSVIVAHYYTDPVVQALAEETGGCVADSLEMARFGKTHGAKNLLVAGVKFMGETAKILTPEKRVFMPTLEATCSLDLGCPAEDFSRFCDEHPDRTVVVYANTSAAVKARADWVVTSSCAVDIVQHLSEKGEKIIWAPDKFLGAYVEKQTGADMLLWNGSCIVHEEFKAEGINTLKRAYPEAAVLVHPESPEPVVALADVVGSTSQLIEAVKNLPNPQFIVATDQGIFYKMQQVIAAEKRNADDKAKEVLIAPTAGEGATCRSCANCPWMAMNSLEKVAQSLENLADQKAIDEVLVDSALAEQSLLPLQRMLDFTQG